MILISLCSLAFAHHDSSDEPSVNENVQHHDTERLRPRKRRRKAAAASSSMHGLLLGAGTLGITGGYIYAPNHKISFTGQYSYLAIPESEKEYASKTYLDTTTLSTLTLRGNLHPLPKAKWFHVSAGLAYSLSTIDVSLPDGTYTIGEETDTSTSATGTVDFSAVQAYVGTGVGYTNKKGIGFFLDLGVNYQGAPIVNMTYDTTATQEAVDAETAILEENYSMFQFYPVMQLGMTYMF